MKQAVLPTKAQIDTALEVTRWYLTTHYGTEDEPGMLAMFCDRKRIGELAIDREAMKRGDADALFSLLLHAAGFAVGGAATGRGPALDHASGQLAGDAIDGSEGVDEVFVVPASDDGAVSLAAQSANERGHEREARFVLAEEHEFVVVGLFFSASRSAWAWRCLSGSPRSSR